MAHVYRSAQMTITRSFLVARAVKNSIPSLKPSNMRRIAVTGKPPVQTLPKVILDTYAGDQIN
jgi:hypothetical protein